MDYNPKVLKENLRHYRKQFGLTQEDVASRLGDLSRSAYAKIESGGTMVSIDRLMRLSELFHISLTQLLTELPEEKAYPHHKDPQHTFDEPELLGAKSIQEPRPIQVTINIQFTKENEHKLLKVLRELKKLSLD
jgi:transcriptional regulator with XRE-family HTH domain